MSYFKLKCAKFDFGWGSAPPQTTLGEVTQPPNHLAVFKGANFEEKAGEEGREGRAREQGEGREG